MHLMVKRKAIHTQWFLVGTALGGAAASALFVVGVGSALWWFWGVLTASLLFLLLLPKSSLESRPGADRRTTDTLLRQWRMPVALLGAACTAALGWLALQQEPLPLLDLRTGGLLAVLFSLLMIALVAYFQRLPLLSFPMLFLGVTFMYTASPLMLYQVEGADAFRYWRWIELDYVLAGIPLVMLAFVAFLLGALIVLPAATQSLALRPVGNTPPAVTAATNTTLRQIGFLCYGASMLVIILLSLQGGGLQLAIEGGYSSYAGARKAGELPLLLLTAFRFLPWSLLILTATSPHRRAYAQTWLCAIPALALMFLSGDRTAPLGLILVMSASSYLLGFPVDWKRTLVVVALVGLLVPLVVNLRQTPVREWSVDLMVKAVVNQVEGKRQYEYSPLSAPLIAMSTNYQTLMGTLMLTPAQEPYRYGADYLRSIAVAVPFATTLFAYVGVQVGAGKPSEWIKDFLDPDGIPGTGYLQLAEAYLQFGMFGVIALYAILGMALPYLWWSLQRRQVDTRQLALTLIVILALLTWVRNDSIGMGRTIAWGWLLVYGAPALSGYLRKTRAQAVNRPPMSGLVYQEMRR